MSVKSDAADAARGANCVSAAGNVLSYEPNSAFVAWLYRMRHCMQSFAVLRYVRGVQLLSLHVHTLKQIDKAIGAFGACGVDGVRIRRLADGVFRK